VKTTTTIGAGLAALALGAVSLAPAAVAADDSGVDVVNTETVQVYVNSDGEVESQRVYEQLSFTGDGSVTVANPIEESGLRNLDGFSGVSADDGVQEVEVEVDGYERLRSVSNYEGELPLEFDISYVLDGEEIEPGDLVGASGALEVTYTVTNVTGQPQEVSFPDGKGGTMTETVEVPIPIVGSMATTVPSSFTDVTSGQANIAGDGKGGTKLSFTMTLFPPLGSDQMEFSYQAQVSDAVVPATSVTALPVNPLEIPTFKTAGDSYQNGADTGVRLADGATTIDTNLLKLRDGAGTLLSGLIQLSDGSDQLASGLAGEAAPGAEKLADGAGRLSDGLGELDGGVGELKAGATQLADGQRKLADGLTKLYDGVDALPRSVKAKLQKNPDYLRLLGALTSMAGGIGTLDQGPQVASLLGGLQKVKLGLTYPYQFLTQAVVPCQDDSDATPCGATNALDLITELKLQPALSGGPTQDGSVAKLKATILSIAQVPACAADPTCVGTVTAVANGIADAQTQSLTELQAALRKVSSGIKTGLTDKGAGIDQLRAGLSTGANPAVCGTAPDGTCGLREAALFLRDYGIPQLVAGITDSIRTELIAGIGVPKPGCDPTSTLRCAAEALADGGGQLTAGIDKLVEGVTLLNDGGGQLADGAGQLADGLGTAADGSERLADGLSQAEDGAPLLVDGADRLSKEGMSQLIEAGEDTAQDYGKMYATIKAGADRADAEKMAYGAPEGAQGLTAYSYELLGDDGEGSRNTKRGIAALGLLGLGAGGFLLRRRLV
jgi:putative membrane protein